MIFAAGGMRKAKGIPRAPSKIEERLVAQLRGYARYPTGEFLPDPVREYRFHPTRRWRFDFAWPEHLVAVECEGGIWTRGRHTRGAGFEADLEKYNAATLAGWRVLRVSSGMVNEHCLVPAMVSELLPMQGA